MLDELTNQPGALAAFARVFADMAAEIRAKQSPPPGDAGGRDDPELDPAAAAGPRGRRPRRSTSTPRCIRRARSAAISTIIFLIDDTHLALTVADVSGKGIPAALFMAVSRTVMRSDRAAPATWRAAWGGATACSRRENTACMFVTMFHGVLDLASGVLRYCNAGHNPPYVLRAAGRARDAGGDRDPVRRRWPTCRIASPRRRCARATRCSVQRRHHRGVQRRRARNSAPRGLKPRSTPARGGSAADLVARRPRRDHRLCRRRRAVRRHHRAGAGVPAVTAMPVATAASSPSRSRFSLAVAAVLDAVHHRADQVEAEPADRRAPRAAACRSGSGAPAGSNSAAVVDQLGASAASGATSSRQADPVRRGDAVKRVVDDVHRPPLRAPASS